ncbi:alpha/beta hydrolase, partial [Herbaspirillum sp. HC18]
MSLWRNLFVAASLLAAPLTLAHAQTPQTVKAKNVVLVH